MKGIGVKGARQKRGLRERWTIPGEKPLGRVGPRWAALGCGWGPALAGRLERGSAFALRARAGVITFSARSDANPLLQGSGKVPKGRSKERSAGLISENEHRGAFLAPETLELVGHRSGHLDEGAQHQIVVAVAIQVAGIQ